jgi:hypothetical protein
MFVSKAIEPNREAAGAPLMGTLLALPCKNQTGRKNLLRAYDLAYYENS